MQAFPLIPVKRYVIFFCDDCDRLAPAAAAFKRVRPEIAIHTLSSLDDLLNQINTDSPVLLLFYLHDKANSYVEVLKAVRETIDGSGIPTLVYRDLPDVNTLEHDFRTYLKV